MTAITLGMPINYAGDFRETIANLADFEAAGVGRVAVPEAYSFDAVSQLGFIAAKTEKMELQTAVLPMYSRTPTNLAMTAAGLDYISGGRAILGIGASGPQVIEGFHGVKYDFPLGRAREHVEICRKVWRRERVEYQGKHYTPAARRRARRQRTGQAPQDHQPPDSRADPDAAGGHRP